MQNMDIAISKEKIGQILEGIYLLLFAAFLGYFFLNTTTFEIVWPYYFYSNIKNLLFVVVILKTANGERYELSDLIICGLSLSCLLIAQSHNGYEELAVVALLILGAKDVSYKKMIVIYLLVSSVLLFVTMGYALTGRIENFVLHQAGRRVRIAFGIVYPTDFSAHIFYIILAFCYLRREKMHYIEIGGIILAAIFVYVFCDARLNTICILGTACVMSYYKISYMKSIKQKKPYKMNPVFSMLLVLSTTLCAIGMIILTMLYSPDNKWMLFADKVLNNRLRMGKKGIDLYGFQVFGQYIEMFGNGNRTTEPLNYFFIDSSYLYIALQYGILAFAVILLFFLIIGARARAEKEWILLWILAIMSVQCIVEHHMIEIAYNPVIWAAFARLKNHNRIFISEKGN